MDDEDFKKMEKAVKSFGGFGDDGLDQLKKCFIKTKPYIPTELGYFAGLAMQGILAHGTKQTSRELAATSVAFAKSLIEELNKETNDQD